MKSLTLGWIWLTASSSILMGQNAQLYTTAEGLPSSHISQLMFDAQDFLWVSTDLGLSRFNGDRFTNYQAEYQNPYRLQESQINSLYIDRDNKYWVAGCDGLYYFDHALNSFSYFPMSPTRRDISVAAIADHPYREHTLIVTTFGWGVRVFDTETFTQDSVATRELHSLLEQTPSNILVDKRGRLWGFEGSDVEIVDLKTNAVTRLSSVNPQIRTEHLSLSSVVQDVDNDCLYFGTGNRGVLRVDLNTLEMRQLDMPLQIVTALAVGPDQLLYVGTETQGLWRYDPTTDHGEPMVSSRLMRFGQNKIHSIAFDSQRNLWLGLYQTGVVVLPHRESSIFRRETISYMRDAGPNLASVTGFASLPDGSRAYALDGAGVVIDRPDGQHDRYTMRNSELATNAILALTTLPNGTLLVGTYQHGVYLIGQDWKLRRESRLAALDRASITDFEHDTLTHTLYIATNGQGLFAMNYDTNELSRPVPDSYGIGWLTNLFLTSDRRLWLSRADHLSCLDLKTGEVTAPRQSKSRVVVNGFAETSDHQLWLASNYGLLRYDQATDSLMLIAEPDNKPRRHYSALMSSLDDRLWLASAGCITMYDSRQNRFVDYIDPMIAEVGTINYHSSKRWNDGSFSFGGDNGVIDFCPEDVDSFRHPSHHLLLTSLWVDNVPTDYDPMVGTENVLDKALWCATQLTLPADRASFSVSFTIQDISGETGVAYSYKLSGYEDEWHPCHGGSKTASYHSLSPGNYVLEVLARQENDLNGEQDNSVMRRLKVRILPPWYATWWATCLWLLLVAAAAWILTRQIMERRRARHRLREAETERQLKEGKLNLLTSVSHEIKTPLTLIISPLRKMMGRKQDPATQSVLEMMYRNALRILMLVNQQMDVRRLDRGELPLHVRELPLRSFLDDLMQYFSSVALSRHITYTLILPDGQDEMTLWADPEQLDKVVMNLLSNAIKFVPDNGTVSVEVTQDEANGRVRISVFNSGSQLPEGQQEAAFSGIGLSIAREITGLHRGELTVRNLEDGVAFDIDLLSGNSHYTPEELTEVKHDAVDPEPEAEQRIEVAASATVEEEDKDRELVEQLNDELREKQRMRERRTALEPTDVDPVKMSSADEKLMRRVMDLIHKNIGDSEFSVETLSTELGISRVHLNRKLKDLLDISPSALIKSVRLKQAALLLIQSNVTVAEVAYSVGFSSPAYFTTNFTQYYGMTPKEFTNTYSEDPDSPELKQLLGK